jgi:serine/threonine-protein kinase HipA
MNKCLICCGELGLNEVDYHTSCSRSLFGNGAIPELPYTFEDIDSLGKEVIGNKISIPGFQKKISLAEVKEKNRKFTIVGLWGNYILKPPSEVYNEMPENEHLSMMMAQSIGIDVVPNGLIKMKDGKLAYITRRIDRQNGTKIPLEDFCQLSGKLSEQKYHGSVELISRLIRKYSDNVGLDLVRLFEIALFSYIIKNTDMHLKNYSMIYKNQIYTLSAAYDLLSVRLMIPEEHDKGRNCFIAQWKKAESESQRFLCSWEIFGFREKSYRKYYQ